MLLNRIVSACPCISAIASVLNLKRLLDLEWSLGSSEQHGLKMTYDTT